MDEPGFRRWARAYRAEAAADDYRIVVAGWDRGRISYTDERDPIQKWRARELIRDTVELVALVLAFYDTDGREGAARLLELQTYDPARSEGRYLLLFEPGEYRRTQLMVERLDQIDLVDLGSATDFEFVTIERCDGSEFEEEEHAEVRSAVLADIRHDFCEAEMRVEFNDYESGLQVHFQDAW